MWDRFTERAKWSIVQAQKEAEERGSSYVSTEHMLRAVLREKENTACRVLLNLGFSIARISEELDRQTPSSATPPTDQMTLTPRGKRVIDLAYHQARGLPDNFIGTEHLLLGLIEESEGIAGRVLAGAGVGLEAVKGEIRRLRAGGKDKELPES